MNVALENFQGAFIPLGTSPPLEGLGEASFPIPLRGAWGGFFAT